MCQLKEKKKLSSWILNKYLNTIDVKSSDPPVHSTQEDLERTLAFKFLEFADVQL